jgi:lipid A 3-O-deacylase
MNQQSGSDSSTRSTIRRMVPGVWVTVTVVLLVSPKVARGQTNAASGIVMTPATFSVLNPSIFGDHAASALGADYGHRPDAKTYLFSASVSHVRFQFGRTYWPFPTGAKTLMTGLDYAQRVMSRSVGPSIQLVSGVQGSVGYGVMNYMNGAGIGGSTAGLLLGTGIRLAGPGFCITPYVAPAYFFARQEIVGFECTNSQDCELSDNGFRFSFGGGVRLDLLKRISFEAGVRKTQTAGAISRRSYGLSYRFGNPDGRGLRDAGTFTLQMDNDFLGTNSKFLDEDYTQGFHFAFNRREALIPLERAVARFNECQAKCIIAASVLVGQEIYTPRYFPSLESNDRPFAGWLYAGLQSAAVSDHDRASLSVKLGVTGPPSLAQQLQVSFHQLVPAYVIPPGWSNQLKFEPGVIVTAAKKYFVEHHAGMASIGVITAGSVSLGNILSDLEGGLTLRAGFNSHPWNFERSRRFGAYASFGVREDAVLHNLFLDGNTFRDGPRVKRVPFVWQEELAGGVSVGSISLHYQRIVRGQEFTTGRRYHPYGTISVTRHGAF